MKYFSKKFIERLRLRLLLVLMVAMLPACGSRSTTPHEENEEEIWVSILPLKGIVEAIVGEHYPIRVLVPPGSSPETFEPTARQLVELNRARLVLGIGLLDFEQNLLEKLGEKRPIELLSQGIEVVAGSCSCAHGHHAHPHGHGIDPHIWTSPRELQTIARNAYEAILKIYPDSTHYTTRYEALKTRIEALDRDVAAELERSGTREFLIYHPALTYYARAYGIEQRAIEHEGKEPSAKRIAELIDEGRRTGCRNILYQSQFPASSVEIIARDLGGEAIPFDPLSEDILTEIARITPLITQHGWH